jgi:hypothetical protein
MQIELLQRGSGGSSGNSTDYFLVVLRIAAVTTLMAGCSPQASSVPAPRLTQHAAVYRIVYDWLTPPGTTIRVIDTAYVVSDHYWAGMLREASDLTVTGTSDMFANRDLKPLDLHQMLDGTGVPLITRAEIKRVFGDKGPRGWPDYHATYGSGYAEFSSIAFNRDSTLAVLYAAYHCGGLCGHGDIVIVTRVPKGAWRIRRVSGDWIS